MPRRRDRVERDDPPEYLLSLPVWITEGRSPDPALARLEWERARREWVRGAPTLDVLNRLYGADFDAGPGSDPRAPGQTREGGHDDRSPE